MIIAFNTFGGSLSVSMTVPVICDDHRVGAQVVTRCNDGQPLMAPVGNVPLGRLYLPRVQHIADAAHAPAPSALAHPTSNATLCINCSFHREAVRRSRLTVRDRAPFEVTEITISLT
jgi:hypothetical protein